MPDQAKRGPGRPPTGKKDTVRVTVYLPPDLDAAMRERIGETGLTLTAYITGLIRADVRNG